MDSSTRAITLVYGLVCGSSNGSVQSKKLRFSKGANKP